MAAPNEAQARELQFVSPRLDVTHAVAVHQHPAVQQGWTVTTVAQPTAPASTLLEDDPEIQDQLRIKRRVFCVSGMIAIYVVCSYVSNWAIDGVATVTALSEINQVAHSSEEAPDITEWLLQSLPSMSMNMMCGMLVPLCGFIGAKRNQQCLLGCFCGCSALSCICSLIFAMILLVTTCAVSLSEPGLEQLLEKCDPSVCAPLGFNITPQDQVVDCFASGAWEQYKPKYSDGPHFDATCPKVFLKCGPDGNEEPGSMSERNLHFPGLPEHPQPVTIGMRPVASSSIQRPAASSSVDLGGFTDSEPAGGGGGTDAQKWHWKSSRIHAGLRRLAFVPRRPLEGGSALDSSGAGGAGNHVREHRLKLLSGPGEMRQTAVTMPENPLSECTTATKSIEFFQSAKVLLPDLAPKLVVYLLVKLVVLLPGICLGCFGCCWGKDLFWRLRSGYRQLDQPQVYLQPSLGMNNVAMLRSTELQPLAASLITPRGGAAPVANGAVVANAP